MINFQLIHNIILSAITKMIFFIMLVEEVQDKYYHLIKKHKHGIKVRLINSEDHQWLHYYLNKNHLNYIMF